MITKQYTVPSIDHVEDLTSRLYETYSRVEVISCAKRLLNVAVLVAVGY